jgi:hypothetical protein
MRPCAPWIALLACAACVAPQPEVGPPLPMTDLETATTARWWIGARQMSGPGWDDTGDQFVTGFDVSTRPPGWPVGIEGGMQFSGAGEYPYYYGYYDYDEDPYQDVFGLSLGLCRRWLVAEGRVLIDLGAGAEWQITTRDESVNPSVVYPYGYVIEDDDNWFGGYARASVGFVLTDGMWLGLELRGSFGPGPELFGDSYSGDSIQETLVLGGGF